MSANERQHGGTHYRKLRIQVWDFILANEIPFMEGNVIRYVVRWRDKGGIDDLKKAVHFLEKLIEYEEGEEKREQAEKDTSDKDAMRQARDEFLKNPPDVNSLLWEPGEKDFTTDELPRLLKEARERHTAVTEKQLREAWEDYTKHPQPLRVRTEETPTDEQIRDAVEKVRVGVTYGGGTVTGYTNYPSPDRPKERDKALEERLREYHDGATKPYVSITPTDTHNTATLPKEAWIGRESSYKPTLPPAGGLNGNPKKEGSCTFTCTVCGGYGYTRQKDSPQIDSCPVCMVPWSTGVAQTASPKSAIPVLPQDFAEDESVSEWARQWRDGVNRMADGR